MPIFFCELILTVQVKVFIITRLNNRSFVLVIQGEIVE